MCEGKGIILPGGNHEQGETFHETAIRELKEETGLDGMNPKYIFGAPDGAGYYCMTFRTDVRDLKSMLKETPEGNPCVTTWNKLLDSVFASYYQLLLDAIHG